MVALVAPIVEKLDGPPKEEFKAKYKPVVYAGKGVPLGDAGQALARPFASTAIRSDPEKLAYLLLISKVEESMVQDEGSISGRARTLGQLGSRARERSLEGDGCEADALELPLARTDGRHFLPGRYRDGGQLEFLRHDGCRL